MSAMGQNALCLSQNGRGLYASTDVRGMQPTGVAIYDVERSAQVMWVGALLAFITFQFVRQA